MLKGSPNAPAIDSYLKDSFEVIRMVHDNLPIIRAVAGRLTPVEDLVEFQAEVTALYAKLALLSEASQIIIQITDAGFDMMTADNVAHQRMLLELGSAALEDATTFAKEDAFQNLREEVERIDGHVDELLELVQTFVNKEDFDSTIEQIQAQLDKFGNLENIKDLIDGITIQLPDGTSVTGVSSALMALYARLNQLDGGTVAGAGRVTELESRVTNHATKIDAQAEATETLKTEVSAFGPNIQVLSEASTELKSRLDNVDAGSFAEGSALESLRTEVTQNKNGIEIVADSQIQIESRLQDTETGLIAQANGLEQLTTTVSDNAQGLTITGERIDAVTASLGGVGNMFPNAGFEQDLFGWEVQSRGAGWADGEMIRRPPTDGYGIPEGTVALQIAVSGTPGGSFAIRSVPIPVEALKSYIASMYLSHNRCTVRIEWRAFNVVGSEIDQGVIDQTSGNRPGGLLLSDWIRSFKKIPMRTGTATVRLYVWVSNATGNPEAFILRPMLEPALPMQELPSPWVGSAAGVMEAVGSAMQTLRTEITKTVDDKIQVVSEAITDVKAEVGVPFTGDFGWEFIQNLHGFTFPNASASTWPIVQNNGALIIYGNTFDPQMISPNIVLNGGNHPIVRAFVRRRDESWDGSLYWANPSHSFSGSHVAYAQPPPVGEWATVQWDLRENADWRSGGLINRLRFDFGASNSSIVDVQWIAIGNFGQGRSAQVTEQLRANVNTVAGTANAIHAIELTVDGKISGTRSVNDGFRSSFEVLADVFRVISSGMQGFEVMGGYQRYYSPGAQIIFGHTFGAQNDLSFWYGPNIGAAACTKANATIWFDKSGNAYFGGMVAQGVLRYFNSSTVTGLVTVTTEAVASNGKPVAVSGKFQYNSSQHWPGAVTFTPTSSRTSALIVIERQYQGEGWVEIARRSLIGDAAAQNGTDGDGSLQYSVSGDVLVTDVASTKIRTYRTRVLSLSTGGYTTNTGTPYAPQVSQYQSIESME